MMTLRSLTLRILTTCLLPTICLAAEIQKPNIIVILADDLGYAELGCFGQTKIKTPNLDRMAAEGQRWTQFYSGAPVCSPSRNVLLTGRHTGGCNIQNLKRVNPAETMEQLGGDWPMDQQAWTLPMSLRAAGYHTAAFGKWGMGEYGTSGSPDKKGVDYFYGYTDHRVCHTFYPKFLWRNGIKHMINDPGVPGHLKQAEGVVNDEKYTGQQHASECIMKEMLSHLETISAPAKNGAKPFFLFYCPLEPHVAMQPPKAWVDKYPREWDNKPYRGERGYTPHSRPHAGYAATISYLDHNVGKLMAKLKDLGLDENTLVIFTSDNGTTHDAGGVDHAFFNSVAELKGLKGSMYEGGIRVPTLMRWPGNVPMGKSIDQPAYSADLMPTLCAIASADSGQTFGENLQSIVTGETERLDSRKPLVWTGGGYGGQVAVRLGDMKAIRRNLQGEANSQPYHWEVYDLAKDRSETMDLAATRRDVIEQAQAVLKREYKLAPGYPELNIFTPESASSPLTLATIKFSSLDSNLDGVLTLKEWRFQPSAKSDAEKHKNHFDSLDKNRDQHVSRQEFLSEWEK